MWGAGGQGEVHGPGLRSVKSSEGVKGQPRPEDVGHGREERARIGVPWLSFAATSVPLDLKTRAHTVDIHWSLFYRIVSEGLSLGRYNQNSTMIIE